MAERVEVPVSPPYPVVVGAGPDLAETISREIEPGTAAVLSDSNVGPLHAEGVVRSLEDAGWSVAGVIEVPAGEASKSLAVYEDVVRRLARSGLTRGGTLFALGGGVVGDLGGFVAASYLRGIGFVVLPTTLLAAVDSSVGGKVGVDLPEGKNLLGAFLQPRLVATDLDWLSTLPEREVRNGLAEVVKMGLLSDGELFEALRLLEDARTGDPGSLQTLILASVRFKAAVVAEDERESGRRAILNYGHTIGHGIEAAASYTLPHGEAISVGMMAEAMLSGEKLGADLIGLHEELLRSSGLPTKASGVSAEEALAAMGRDKKRRPDEWDHRFVLLHDVGVPEWGVPVSEEEARRTIGAVLE